MNTYTIPFNKPYLCGKELSYIAQVCRKRLGIR